MLSIISLNDSAHLKFTNYPEKLAIASAIITLVSGIFIYNLMGGPDSFLPTLPSAGYALSAAAFLFLIDTVRYALLSYAEHKFAIKITLQDHDFQNFQNYQYRGEVNQEQSHAKNVRFYHGNCDENEAFGIKDLGWGCAWRSIEICASPYKNLRYNFRNLYGKYSACKNIKKHEWAEPGYGKTFFDDNEIPSQLYLYNRDSGSDKTPTNNKLASFREFTGTILQHFKKYKTPIMVDDGVYAFTILGVKTTENGNVILWIADPHKTSIDAGLYYLILDQNGNKLESTGLDNNNGVATAQKIDPAKGWMLLFPQHSQNTTNT